MRTRRMLATAATGLAAATLLAVGIPTTASATATTSAVTPASGYGALITWQSGLGGYLWAQSTGGSLNVNGQPFQWYDSENSDGTWNEIDVYGHCLAAYGRSVVTENCNPTANHTTTNERWHEESQGSGNGWKLVSVANGYYLDWTGVGTWGSVYAHAGDANNANERWY